MQPESSDHEKNKADEEFLPYSSRFSSLSPLKVLTLVGLPLALYQIVTGFIYSSTQTSPFNIALTLSGFFTLTLLGLALNWIRSTANDGEKEMVLFDKKRETLSTLSFLICSLVKLGTTPLLLANLFTQRNYIGDYLTASSSTTAFDELGAPIFSQNESMGTFSTLNTLFIMTEVVLFFYSMLSTVTTLNFVNRPRKMHANFTYIANAILLGAALSLAFTASHVSNMESYSRLENLFPSWNLKALLGLGGVAAGLSLPVWLVNFRKWRIGFFSLALILGNLGLLSMVFTGIAYSHANGVYQHYSNTESLKQLKGRMSYVSQEELMSFGCPAKYLSEENCGSNMLLTAWESDAQTSTNESCLNIKCSGLLGQVYSDKFIQVANWGLLTSVTSILMAASLLFSSVNRGAFKHETRSRKNFTWLALLGTVGVISVLTYGFYPVQNIQEYQSENSLNMKAWSYESLEDATAAVSDESVDTTEAWSLGNLFSGGSISTPSITPPRVSMPSLSMPSVTMPQVYGPQVYGPQVRMPSVNMGSLNSWGSSSTPAAPVPTESAETAPADSTESVETTEAWSLGNLWSGGSISAPSITPPRVSMPSLSMPTLSMPRVNMPQVYGPQVYGPQVRMPSVNMGSLNSWGSSSTPTTPVPTESAETAPADSTESVETTEAWSLGSLFGGSSTPTITAPTITPPTVQMPSLTMPSLNMGSLGSLTSPTASLDTLGKDYANKMVSSALGMDKNVAYQLAQMVQFKTSRYLILNPKVATKELEVVKTGGLSETYQNFVDSLDAQKAQLGLVRTTVKGQDKVIGVLWAPKSAPSADTDLLVKTFVPDYSQVSYSQTLKAPLVIAADKNALKIENIESKLATLPTVAAWDWSQLQDAANQYQAAADQYQATADQYQTAQDEIGDSSTDLRAPGAPAVKNMKAWAALGDLVNQYQSAADQYQAAADQYQAAADQYQTAAGEGEGEDYSTDLRAPGAPAVKKMKAYSWSDIQDQAEDYSTDLRAPGAPAVKKMKAYSWSDIQDQAEDYSADLRAPGAPAVKKMKAYSWSDIQDQAEDYSTDLRAPGAPAVKKMKAYSWSDIQDQAEDYSTDLRAPGAPAVKKMKAYSWSDIQDQAEDYSTDLRAPGAPAVKKMKAYSWSDIQDQAEDYSTDLRAPRAPWASTLRAPGAPAVKKMKAYSWSDLQDQADDYSTDLRAPGAPAAKNMKAYSWSDIQDQAEDYSTDLRAPGAPALRAPGAPVVKNMKAYSWSDIQDQAEDYSTDLRAPGAPAVKKMKAYSWSDIQDQAEDYSTDLRAPGAPAVKNMKTWEFNDLEAAQDQASDYTVDLRAPGAPQAQYTRMTKRHPSTIDEEEEQPENSTPDDNQASDEEVEENSTDLRAPGAPAVKSMKTWEFADLEAAQDQVGDYSVNLRAPGAPQADYMRPVKPHA